MRAVGEKKAMAQNKHKDIFETLRSEIVNGKCDFSKPLPSASALMKKFGVARATAVAALKSLEREGLAESRRGSGTYPVKREPTAFGVIVPEAHIPFYTCVCEGIANFANNAGGGHICCYGALRGMIAPQRESRALSRLQWEGRALSRPRMGRSPSVSGRRRYAHSRGCAWKRMSRACSSRPRVTDG